VSRELLILGVVLIAVVAALTFAVTRRRASAPRSGVADDEPVPLMPTTAAADILLVPMPTRGNQTALQREALALGSLEALEAFERSGLGQRTPGPSRGPLRQVVRRVMAVGAHGVTRNADRDIEAGRIVALSKETMEQLEKHKPAYAKSGQMLGLVRGDKGRIRHVMRLDRHGAKAVVASNAATLAMSAAVGEQLDRIEEQLTEIKDTVKQLLDDADRKRLAETVGANQNLLRIANRIRDRGEMTAADRGDLSALKLPVSTGSIETEFKFRELLDTLPDGMHRRERQDQLERLLGKERLEYWLALRIETELAHNRLDLLDLYWEQSQHPETAGRLAAQTGESIAARQERLAELGQLLKTLADPEARTRLDPLRQISKRRLGKHQKVVTQLLERHGGAFSGPCADPGALIEGGAQEVFLITGGGPASEGAES
jgi:hypothetical protein